MKVSIFSAFIGLSVLASTAACSDNGGFSGGTPVASPVFAEATSVQEDARLAAVMIHADWCSSCRIMEPKLAALKDGAKIEGVQFLTLDYTNRDKSALFAKADSLGIGEPIRAKLSDGIKTGILLLVDMDDQTIAGDLRKTMSPNEIRAAIIDAAKKA